jgi:hypothetical protein
MVEAAVAMAEALVVAISVAGISPVAVAISLGLVGVILVAIALRNTEEGILITEIISGTIVISFLEVPSGMMTPTTGMIIIRTTDIRTMDIGTTAFTASSCSNPVDKLTKYWLSTLTARKLSGPNRAIISEGHFADSGTGMPVLT